MQVSRASEPTPVWERIDRAFRANAAARSGLDANEARLLREAEQHQIWRRLGMVSALDYLEHVLGYGPRVAFERLRVARALGDLPVIEGALAAGMLRYSAVRELTRVALPSTEREWLAATAGKRLREVEDMVAGRKPGDRPNDRPTPDLELRPVTLMLTPAAFAVLRQSRHDLDVEHATRLTDSEFIEARYAPPRAVAADSEVSGRAKFQIAVTVCESCKSGWQDGGGVRVPLDAATLERAHCDAQHLGTDRTDLPARATQDISPATVRLVWHRDGGRCQTPGCRSARNLELHHIVHREHGGDHSPSNITLRCSSCHQAHHAGLITIGGTAPDALTLTRAYDPLAVSDPATAHVGTAVASTAHVGTTSAASAQVGTARASEVIADARAALCTAGWSSVIARAAVETATARVGTSDLIALIRESFRSCSRRNA